MSALVVAAGKPRTSTRWARLAPAALIVSVLARIIWTYTVGTAANFVDLHVYVGGGSVLGTGNRLYDYVYTGPTAAPLPFTYPPFAAVLFYPLHVVPWPVVALGWELGVVLGLYAVVRLCQHLVGGGPRWVAMWWTAAGIWLEPIRSTLDYGQINVALCLAVLAAVCSRRWWISGLLVGLAAGVKLTPAISGLYFVGARRWGAVVFSGVVFLATIVVSVLAVGDEVRHYFAELMFDPHRMGAVATPFNQSLRGGLGTLFGRDDGHAPVLFTAVAVAGLLAFLAWRAVWTPVPGPPDRLGAILVVELFGLLVSPISWTHHWVWLIPLMVWLVHGPRRSNRGARVLCALWLVATLCCGTWIFTLASSGDQPWYLVWVALVFPGLALATLGWMAVRPADR